jgi:hypothetical protein
MENTEGTVRRVVPKTLRKHLFLTAFVVVALIGGAIRLLPTSLAAAAPGSSNSTACSAK